ncbi:MAG: hypothetical protein K2O69_07155 [Odoribacter sp.]|nr:hypothetical protein [Odoribacter sp.]
MRKGICLLLFLCCLSGLRAQDVEEAYERNKRDVKSVSAYVKALRIAGQEKQADSIVKEFMSRCPVVQLEDKDTYLLLAKYAFEDVYSNAFDYGLFIGKKMRWDRERKEGEEAKQALFYRLRWGGGEDEIDKRYEVLTVLSRNLGKEIDKCCCPVYREKRYRMPDYDSLKVAHLNYLLQKGELLNDGSMRVKMGVYEDYVAGNHTGILQKLWLAHDLKLKDVGETYAMRILSVLADAGAERHILESGIALLHRYADGQQEGMVSCYGVLGELYAKCGDEENGNRYKQLGKKTEAERMERYGGFINIFKNKE